MAELLKRTGVVKAVQGHVAVVVTVMEPECETCKAKETCHTMGGGGVNSEVKARNTAGADVGDLVTISIKGSSLVKVSFLVYFLPILALMAGVGLGHFLSDFIPVNKNILVGVLGLFAFCCVFIWLKKKGDQIAVKKELMPEVIKKKTPRAPINLTDFSCPVKRPSSRLTSERPQGHEHPS